MKNTIVATLKRGGCCPDGSGGTTWIETKTFCEADTIADVMAWAKKQEEFPRSLNVTLSFDHGSLE